MPLMAEEPALGRVLSVDEEKGEAILSLRDDTAQEARELKFSLQPGQSLKTGDLVRIWPQAVAGSRSSGPRVRPVGAFGNRPDPTGVRSRLMRDRGRGRGGPHGGRGGR